MLALPQGCLPHIPNGKFNRTVSFDHIVDFNHISHSLDYCIDRSFNCCSRSFGRIAVGRSHHLGFVGSCVDRLTY
tara:strand:+ start:260 stop:484 length:225 start_codon:yes stop_codon:yes gene_type:complete